MALSTPFAHVLHTNYAATPSEAQAIQNLLAAPRDELSQLASEISRLQNTLNCLTSRYDHLKTHVDAHLALISPLRRLPRELISEIFIACLSADRNATQSPAEAPLLLTTISKGMRDVALATPQLWNSLHVHVPKASVNDAADAEELVRNLQQRREGIEKWVERSMCLPLSMSIHMSGYGRLSGSISDAYLSLLESIVFFSRRWKDIQLHLSPFFVGLLNSLVEDLEPEDVPWLKSVEIFLEPSTQRRLSSAVYPSSSYREGSGNGKPLLPFRDLIRLAPSLQSFAVHQHSQPLHQLQLPWANLTDLTFKSPCDSSRLTVSQTLSILANSPNLSSCTLGVLLTPVDPASTTDMIQLNSLCALSLHFTLPNDDLPAGEVEARFNNLFGVIRAPGLTRLAFIARAFDFRRGIGCIPFMPLLEGSASSPPLEELYLSAPLKSQSILISCLRSLPALTHLCLDPCTMMQNRFDPECKIVPVPIVDDVLVQRLTVGLALSNADTDAETTPSPLCPRLEKLVLPSCRHASEEALLAFARSRTSATLALARSSAISTRSQIVPLKYLDVSFACSSDKQAQESSLALATRPRSSTMFVSSPSPSFISPSILSSIADLGREGVLVSWRHPVQDSPTPYVADSAWEGAMSTSMGVGIRTGMRGNFGWDGLGTQGMYTR